jgi:hypothetical protein
MYQTRILREEWSARAGPFAALQQAWEGFLGNFFKKMLFE